VSLNDLKNEGWKIVSSFGSTDVIVEQNNTLMLVEEKTGKIIVSFKKGE